MTLKRIRYIVLLSVTVILFSGCASKVIEVKKPLSVLTADKSKGYFIFTRSNDFFASAGSNIVTEINNKTFEPKLIAILPGRRMTTVYQTNEGKHCFQISLKVPLADNIQTPLLGNILCTDIKNGQNIYINILSTKTFEVGIFGAAPPFIAVPVLYSKDRDTLRDDILSSGCTKKTFDKYLFDKLKEKKDPVFGTIKHIANSNYFHVEITCQDDKVVSYYDKFLKMHNGKNEINKFPIVTLRKVKYKFYEDQKAQMSEMLKYYYSKWDKYFRNVPLTPNILARSLVLTKDKYFQKYNNVKIELEKTPESISPKVEDTIKNELIKELSNFNGNNEITVKINIESYQKGSAADRLGKKALISGSKAKQTFLDSVDVLALHVNSYNMSGDKIGEVIFSIVDTDSIAIRDIKVMIADAVAEYIKMNFLEQK